MSDKEARVLAAADTIEVNGKEFKLHPIGMQQLHEVQRAAVEGYKRDYLQTWSKNLDLLPGDRRDEMLERKFDEAARWDIGNLPVKLAHDVRPIPITQELTAWMEKVHGDVPKTESAKRAVVASTLDSGGLKPEQVEQMTGVRPKQVKIPYDSWWVTATYDGMITFICASLNTGGQKIERKDVAEWPLAKVMEAARKVEQVTAPALGNM